MPTPTGLILKIQASKDSNDLDLYYTGFDRTADPCTKWSSDIAKALIIPPDFAPNIHNSIAGCLTVDGNPKAAKRLVLEQAP